ncbi:hypothetical protein DdX_13798 [Ditylenchus destructor]|uniref:Uncharacterized protein n=1 Tax=Ditylenchus destructor TaxID=166010 RepID=A0AAD4QZ79_9BILA|nr:hypothetical protein DdX_13798 [Ditylenchus destructor]
MYFSNNARGGRLSQARPMLFSAVLIVSMLSVAFSDGIPNQDKPALRLMGPMPAKSGEGKGVEKPYFNPKEYKISDYMTLIQGLNQDIKSEWRKFDQRVESVAQTVSQMVEQINALESSMKKRPSLSAVLPQAISQIDLLLVALGIVLVFLISALIMVGCFSFLRFSQPRVPPQYASVEKLLGSPFPNGP